LPYLLRRNFLYASLGITVGFGLSYLMKDHWYPLIKHAVPYEVETLKITDLDYPKTVNAGSVFTVKVIVKHILDDQKDVFVDVYDDSGLYRGGFYWILKGKGAKVYTLMVAAPLSANKSWALKVHLNGEYKQTIYLDVKESNLSPLTKVKLHVP
jgi:hypothetical protein